ncbi:MULTISPECIES: hypothetical protein [Brevibacillus]|uniref:Uncharacterized protein n=2 Tax=Brevibacillus TaxID=55080 RepID=A0A075R8H5_BRELA|nr:MULTISPECIES: hypothetical protein [Brevibacillus]AIG28154.1 hypothetical protein BRLA_c038710 [Brevibacillus laterosporus LMG 15441]ERM16298.1 hypothetical protein P615_24160 [Brevibacillus laterosporus PE36]MBA4533791.1 hypothetical protein [Brevibacillus halotolerans]MCR8965980.1 hypothetical protein [Brevibacillus laterosporus]MCR8986747.1 hypothetical protein [Brevibacillus laterosporus]
MTVMEKIKQMEDELQKLKQEVEKAEKSKQIYIDDETSHDVLTEVYN